jgi:CHAT domain-containing protein
MPVVLAPQLPFTLARQLAQNWRTTMAITPMLLVPRESLLTTGSRGAVPLPPELAQGGEKNLSHPAYWAAFTMIGSPW